MEGDSLLCSIPTKLNSSNDKRMKMADATDRISNLPEPILHHILSLLDMKEVVQTSLVSRSWRNLWISLPTLNFNHSLWNKVETLKIDHIIEEIEWGYQFNAYRKNEFMGFVDEILDRHEGSSICKFHLLGDYYCDEDRIGRWIVNLVKQHPQEVDINITPQLCFADPERGPLSEPYELPSCLFNSEVKVFKLHVDTSNINDTFQLPDSMCSAARLKSLHLVLAKLPKGDSNRELLLSCPVLEDLIITDCDYMHLDLFIISALQLKNLVLDNELWGRTGSCKIKIISPNLVSFHCNNIFEDYYLENLSCLYNANMLCLVNEVEAEAKSFIRALAGVRNATILELSCWFNYKASLESLNLFDRLPQTYHNLKCLKLQWRSSSRIGLIANLLKRSPFIETFTLEIIKDVPKENWVEELSFQCVFHHLKSIKIIDLDSYCENEFKLVEFLLKNALVLESVRVEGGPLQEVRKKLDTLPRASSSATIQFL